MMKEVVGEGSASGGRVAPAHAPAIVGRTQQQLQRGNVQQQQQAAQQVEAGDWSVAGAGGSGDGDEDALGAGRASYGDDLDTLDRRRTEELKLIGEYDS